MHIRAEWNIFRSYRKSNPSQNPVQISIQFHSIQMIYFRKNKYEIKNA